ncbi:glycosyltransferase [Chitinispirillales bacterium ANBcel5]|uniref:glycosyltransferase n=1 Tax=Cellulosispirillum alkaliphilum TaxID=3039283 RepID=UPI002A56E32A|nr:glycosyltransferase [Chitinispirillales bacterium ANBcel5]
MALTVLNVAYPFSPLKERTAGGAEQILLQLDRALVENNLRSIVIASRGSKVFGTLIETSFPDGKIDEKTRSSIEKEYKAKVEEVANQYKVNIIHYHGINFNRYFYVNSYIPSLITIHLPLSWYSDEIYSIQSQQVYFNCVSNHQFTSVKKKLNNLYLINNGVPENNGSVTNSPGKYALCMGRICPEKNFHEAFDAAKKANIPLLLVGEVFPYEEHIKYYQNTLLPRIDEKKYRFIGSASLFHRYKLLRNSRCLLVSSKAPETSSLVAMEALSCGTPVIAYTSGALKDIVENGKNGFLVENIQEMAEAIKNVSEISREYCKNTYEHYYSRERMVKEYINTYNKIINKCKMQESNVSW